MVNNMFSYTVAKNADKAVFLSTCSLIQMFLKKYKKEKLLQDVDGTTIQIYRTKNGKVKVVNDYEVDAVYVDSEIDLKSILAKKPQKEEDLILFIDDTVDIGKEPFPIISEDIRRLHEKHIKEIKEELNR